jgi:hypothetical protein
MNCYDLSNLGLVLIVLYFYHLPKEPSAHVAENTEVGLKLNREWWSQLPPNYRRGSCSTRVMSTISPIFNCRARTG